MKNKILILGGNGFLGQHLQNFLFDNYFDIFEVIVVDNKEIANNHFSQIKLDLFLNNNLENLILKENPDYLINLVGIIKSDDASLFLKINALFSSELLSIFEKHNNLQIKKILLIGSAAEYGGNRHVPLNEQDELLPINDYGFSKLIQTEIAKYYSRIKNVPVCIARAFNVIGRNVPLSASIGSFINQIKNQPNGGVIKTGYLGSKRDYLDVEDVCSAFLKIILDGVPGEVYNVCSGNSIGMQEILEKLIAFSGKVLSIDSQDNSAATDINISLGNNKKLLKLGWNAGHDIDQSLKKTLL